MRRFYLMVLVGLVLGTTTLFAGGGKEAGAVGFDPNTFYTVSIGCYGDLEKAYKTVFASPEFKRQYPNITVKFQTSDFSGHHNRLTTVLAAGEATNDIEAVEIIYVAQFIEGGRLANFSDPVFGGETVADKLVDSAVSIATNSKGNLVAIPVDIAPAVLFYREDLAAASGVSEDRIQNLGSWDELIDLGADLTRDRDGDGEIDQYALPNAAEAGLIMVGGGKTGWFGADGQPLTPKDKFMDALNRMKRMRDMGIDADMSVWSGLGVSALSGDGDVEVAMVPGAASFGGGLRNWMAPDVDGWRVATLPGDEGALAGGTFLVIPSAVDPGQQAAAWEVVKYLSTNQNAQEIIYRSIDAFPVLKSVYEGDVLNESVDYFGGQPVGRIYADAAKAMPDYRINPYDPIADGIWGNAVGEMLLGIKTPDEAYQQAVNEILATAD